MNLFSGTGELARGVMNLMNNNFGSSQKEVNLRKSLETCTYPDETKYMIEKAVKQVFHVYPFFNVDILMFNEKGFSCRYIELKGILEIDIKGKTCKVDFNMMLPSDYPRSPPFLRIVNRNPDYKVDPLYQPLRSKTDMSSYILNQTLNSWKNWHPSSSLVNVIIECYDVLKNRFPFSKPSSENNLGGNNVWGSIYNNKNNGNNNNGEGFGFVNANTNNNAGWGNNNTGWNSNNNAGWNNNNNAGWNNNNNNNNWANNWGANNNTNSLGSPSSWGNNNNWANNNWNNQNNQWQGNTGGMAGIIASNPTNSIAAAQKYVGKQRQTLVFINNQYLKVLEKNQLLDTTKQSLESEESNLRRESFQMATFLKSNQQNSIPDLSSIVSPSNERSEQVLDLVSSLKAREECIGLLQTRFCNEQLSLQQFMKHLRKIEEVRFQEKVLLQKCIHSSA